MFEAVRQAIAARLESTKRSGYTLVVDNNPFDWNRPPEAFDHVMVTFYGGDQIGMAAAPKTRDLGFLYLDTHVKAGAASRAAALSMDWLKGAFEYQILTGAGFRITFEAFQAAGSSGPQGWSITHSKILFRVHPA